MPKELDSFQQLRIGKIFKSTLSGVGFKKNKVLIKTTLNMQFGINRKQDNQFKTKQLNLF